MVLTMAGGFLTENLEGVQFEQEGSKCPSNHAPL